MRAQVHHQPEPVVGVGMRKTCRPPAVHFLFAWGSCMLHCCTSLMSCHLHSDLYTTLTPHDGGNISPSRPFFCNNLLHAGSVTSMLTHWTL
jgi:hypothetical protein